MGLLIPAFIRFRHLQSIQMFSSEVYNYVIRDDSVLMTEGARRERSARVHSLSVLIAFCFFMLFSHFFPREKMTGPHHRGLSSSRSAWTGQITVENGVV